MIYLVGACDDDNGSLSSLLRHTLQKETNRTHQHVFRICAPLVTVPLYRGPRGKWARFSVLSFTLSNRGLGGNGYVLACFHIIQPLFGCVQREQWSRVFCVGFSHQPRYEIQDWSRSAFLYTRSNCHMIVRLVHTHEPRWKVQKKNPVEKRHRTLEPAAVAGASEWASQKLEVQVSFFIFNILGRMGQKKS